MDSVATYIGIARYTARFRGYGFHSDAGLLGMKDDALVSYLQKNSSYYRKSATLIVSPLCTFSVLAKS